LNILGGFCLFLMGKIEFSLSFKMVQKYENPEKILTIRKNPDISKFADN